MLQCGACVAHAHESPYLATVLADDPQFDEDILDNWASQLGQLYPAPAFTSLERGKLSHPACMYTCTHALRKSSRLGSQPMQRNTPAMHESTDGGREGSTTAHRAHLK